LKNFIEKDIFDLAIHFLTMKLINKNCQPN